MSDLGPPRLPWTLPFAVLLGLAYLLGALLGLLAGAGRSGKRAGVLLAVLASPLPLLVPVDEPIARFVMALASLLAVIRSIDLLRGAELGSFARRFWFAVTPFDVRQTKLTSPGVDPARLGALLGYATLAAATFLALSRLLPRITGAPALLFRYGVGLVFMYAAVDTTVALIHVGYRLVGIALPDFHRAPILSTSLQEFWGIRWNRPVHEWLSRHCFTPLARKRRPVAGVIAAFLGSTAIHVFIAAACVPLSLTLAMGGFFLAHGALVLMERWLGVGRWRPALGRVWTVGCFLLTGPLFVEPVLRVLAL